MPFRFWSKQRAELDLKRELAHHLHHLTEQFIAEGHSPEAARRLALVNFGGPEQIKEECRDNRAWAWTTGLAQDLSFGLRMLRRTPIVTAAAVLSLALGIGANAAIVSLMDLVLWRDLPVPAPEQLSLVHWTGPFDRSLTDAAAGGMYSDSGVSVADFFSYRAFRELRTALSNSAAVAGFCFSDAVSTSFAGHPAVAQERPVSGNFFDVLQIRAALGRTLTDADDTVAAPHAVVVSHNFWTHALNADPTAIGRTLVVNNHPATLVGVLPRDFYGLTPGDSTDIYAPLHHASWITEREDQNILGNDRFWGTSLLLRRNAGVSAAALTTRADAVFRSTWTRPPQNAARAPRLRLDPGNNGLEFLRREFRNPLLVLGTLVTLLLVIACINIANLLLARASARQREFATRIALGCGQGRLIRQFLTESAILALLGGIASLLVAYLTANLLGRFLVANDTTPLAVSTSWRILATVGITTGFTLLLFGLFPAWRTSLLASPGAGTLRQHAASGSETGFSSRPAARAGRALILVQIAMSVVLVLAAVIFTRNLLGIESSDPGFDRRNLIVFSVRPGTSGYAKDRLAQFYRDLEHRMAAVPGVQSVGLASIRPMNVGGWWESVRLAGHTESLQTSFNGVTPGYLPLYTSRVLAGRNFSPTDLTTQAKKVLIGADLAAKLTPGPAASLIGRDLELSEGAPGKPLPRYEIIGVVPAIAATSLKERPFTVWTRFPNDTKEATVVLRTAIPPRIALPEVRKAMLALDPDLPLVDTMTMEEQIAKGLQRERMFATLCSAFGALALILAVVGLYGVITYSVSRRSGEIGIRLALGATPGNVLTMVLREGVGLALLGILAAAPVVWYGATFLNRELYQMKPLEPVSLTVSLAIMVLAVLAAVLIPAFRASSLEPARTLRHQ